MPARMIFDTLEEVPEHLRSQAKLVDEADKSKGYTVDPKGLLEKNVELLDKNKKYQEQVKLLEKYKDIDPEKAREALSKMQQIEEDQLKKAGEWEQLKGQLTTQHSKEKADLEQRASNAENRLHSYRVDNAVGDAIRSKKGSVPLLLPTLRNHVKYDAEKDSFTVVDEKGQARLGLDGKGNAMTLEELVADFSKKDDFSRAFEASAASGSGAAPNKGGAHSGGKAFTMTREAARDTKAYQNLKAEASKVGATVEIVG